MEHQTQDSCIISSFRQQSGASAQDTHLIEAELGYVGIIVHIYELGYCVCKKEIYNANNTLTFFALV